MKSKKKKSIQKTVEPKTTSELIEALTTSGHASLNQELISNLWKQICSSEENLQQVLRSVVMQLTRPHAQIRLGSLKIIAIVTNSQDAPLSLLKENVVKATYQFRDQLLLQLQDILPFVLRTKDSDKPLPPPKSAADMLQCRTLELLLLWEREADGPQWRPSPRIKGQLTSVMRYLRTPPKLEGISSRLREVSQLLLKLVQEREDEATQRRRNEQTTNAILRRRLIETRDAFLEQKSMIEENLTSLESVLRILVPDPFEEMGGVSGAIAEPLLNQSSFNDPREHGILFGTSSGFGASFASGNTVSFSMEVSNPSTSFRTNQQEDDDDEMRIPRMRLQLTDDIRILRDSGQEFVNVATRKHRPLLSAYYELSQICFSDVTLTFALTDQSTASALLGRMDRLTSRFCNGLIFEDPNGPTSSYKHVDNTTDEVGFMSSSDSSDENEEAGFIEASSFDASLNCTADKIVSKRVTCITDKLPWETDLMTPSLSKSSTSNGTTQVKFKINPVQSHHRKLDNRDDICILSLDDKDLRHWRAEDTQHRFWKPMDPSEYQPPETDYIEAVISLGGSTRFETPVNMRLQADKMPALIDSSTDQKTASLDKTIAEQALACWTPLPQLGRLCNRRDQNGRCRIHGKVFPRLPDTGELANPQTDASRLATEQAIMQKRQTLERKDKAKKNKHRRYPNLEDISPTAQKAAATKRLRNRLSHPKNVRKLADKLDDDDRRQTGKMFIDSFHRTFSR